MRRSSLALLLLVTATAATYAMAQAASAPPQQHQARPAESEEREEQERAAAPETASTLPPDTPVITIHGVCDKDQPAANGSAAECKTVVTRDQFEKLADTLQPKMPPQVKRQLGNQYPQILYMAQEAQKRGLENDPHYQALLAFTKMELLRLELDRWLQTDADKISDSEIQDYYEKNSKNFEQASFQRIFVPKARQTDTPKDGATPEEMQKQREASTAAMKRVADDLRARAEKGEEFDKLQKDAYDQAGVKATPPPTANPKVRRTGLPPSLASVFDLKGGELSPVIDDVQGYFIYRLQSKTTPPLADVKDEIRNTIRSQRLQDSRAKLQNAVSADLNKDYFGVTPQEARPPLPMPSKRPRPAPAINQPKQ
jgi:hypothetical protein